MVDFPNGFSLRGYTQVWKIPGVYLSICDRRPEEADILIRSSVSSPHLRASSWLPFTTHYCHSRRHYAAVAYRSRPGWNYGTKESSVPSMRGDVALLSPFVRFYVNSGAGTAIYSTLCIAGGGTTFYRPLCPVSNPLSGFK